LEIKGQARNRNRKNRRNRREEAEKKRRSRNLGDRPLPLTPAWRIAWGEKKRRKKGEKNVIKLDNFFLNFQGEGRRGQARI
jgi:hypothetical protein